MMTALFRFAPATSLVAFARSGAAARADIYTWIDAAGAVNVSNLSPPDGVRVTRITHENPAKSSARPDTARNETRDAEVQVLSERVQQLEHEVALARSFAPSVPPPLMMYPALPPVPMTAARYPVDAMSSPTTLCDSPFGGCGHW